MTCGMTWMTWMTKIYDNPATWVPGVIEPWNVERKKYCFYEMTTKKILFDNDWNDEKTTVDPPTF